MGKAAPEALGEELLSDVNSEVVEIDQFEGEEDAKAYFEDEE